MLDIRIVPCLRDNYAYLLHDPATGATGIVDPSEAAPVMKALKETGWRLTHILNTHHHPDHTGGNLELKGATGAKVVGPRPDRERIPGIDIPVDEGEHFALGGAEAEIFFIPGHTRGHIAFWFKDSRAL
ncbi:MAG: MBL fold metallo-hydrolase, partial [Candidatus Eiseniibacteriota bacterium]